MNRVLLIAVPAPEVEQNEIEVDYWKWHYSLKTNLTYTNLNHDQLLKFGNTENQNIGLLSIASALEEKGISVKYLAPSIDYSGPDREEDFWNDIKRRIDNFQPQFIAFSSPTCSIELAIEYAKRAKEVNPKIITLIGGAHVNGVDGEDLKEIAQKFDYVMRGKGEIPTVNLVTGNGDLSGISYMEGDKIVKNPINLAGFPGYPKADNKLLNIKELPAARIFTSLGCGGKCIFCVDINTKKYVEIADENIIEEILYLYNNLGTRYFYLGDENFFMNKKRAFALLEKIKQLDLDVIFGFQARIESTNEDVIRSIASLGNCTEIQYGVESANQKILDISKKSLDIRKVKQICQLTKKYGINTHCYFLVGLPGETKETAKETQAMITSYLKEGIIDMVEYRCVIPFPGSAMWNNRELYGIHLKHKNWKYYRGENKPPYDLNTMESCEIYDFYLNGLKDITEIYKERYRRDFGNKNIDINVQSAVTEGGF